jgi:hypothetical protein
MQGSHLQGLQVQSGLPHLPDFSPQLQLTQLHGSHVQLGLLQVLGSVTVITKLLDSSYRITPSATIIL